VCSTSCARAVSLPRAPVLDASMVRAHDRNERSRHEPATHTGSLDQHPVFRGKAQRGGRLPCAARYTRRCRGVHRTCGWRLPQTLDHDPRP
jgi:hypothetical protein